MLNDCNNHIGSCSQCKHYKDCEAKFISEKARRLTPEENNPSTLNYEIYKFDFNDNGVDINNDYKIDITEVPDYMIIKSMEISDKLPDTELRIIVKSAIKKNVASKLEDATVVDHKNNLFHFIFECSDCAALNDFTDYCHTDNAIFYCRYCGKNHVIDLSNLNKKDDE